MLLSSSLCRYIASHSSFNMLIDVCGRWEIDMNHITELFNFVYAWNWHFCPKWTLRGAISINTFVSQSGNKNWTTERSQQYFSVLSPQALNWHLFFSFFIILTSLLSNSYWNIQSCILYASVSLSMFYVIISILPTWIQVK